MNYVIGVSKAYNCSKKQRGNEKHRKCHFCYGFDVESGKFKRVRISFFKAVYYKITFIFGLKSRMIGTPKKPILKCLDCKKKHFSIVNFWDRNTECPYC